MPDDLPATHLLLVGDDPLTPALVAQSALLGWTSMVVDPDDADCERQIETMGGSDAVVLLTHHDRAGDLAIIAAALRRDVAYVGGLGSRARQSPRRARLLALGLSEQQVAAYRGPIGLDLAATNPSETALAVCAEIVARLHQRSARPLSDSEVRIHA